MMERMKKGWIKTAFILAGATGGFLYWHFVGCTSGTCPIKSVWYYTVLWGAVLGYLTGDIIMDFIKKRRKDA